MKLLVLAHTPPPHHGQSYMVELLLRGLGGDCRARRPRRDRPAVPPGSSAKTHPIDCYHVNCRFSDRVDQIGRLGWKKPFLLLRYCLEAVWCRFRYGIRSLYYVPAPGLRAAVYRDWVVMALCRPFFSKVILHWHAVGLGAWLQSQANAFERWLTRWWLGKSDLSLVLGGFYRSDVEVLAPRRIEVVPNGIRDPCPGFEQEVLPRRSIRAARRQRALAGQALGDSGDAGSDPMAPEFQVLFLSLCMREKGLFDTLEAVALINQRLAREGLRMRVRLTVAGKFFRQSERAEFERRIAQPDLSLDSRGVVSYAGFVSGAQKNELFEQSDCFCFPTYYPMEGHPVVLVEAMAFGLPIIATRWRAVPEMFPGNYVGLVEPRSPDAIAELLHRFMRQPPNDELRRVFLERYTDVRFIAAMTRALMSLDVPEGADS